VLLTWSPDRMPQGPTWYSPLAGQHPVGVGVGRGGGGASQGGRRGADGARVRSAGRGRERERERGGGGGIIPIHARELNACGEARAVVGLDGVEGGVEDEVVLGVSVCVCVCVCGGGGGLSPLTTGRPNAFSAPMEQ
jgi:hypothetical protein